MAKQKHPPHMFAFASMKLWRRLIRENGGVDKSFRSRYIQILLTSTFTSPLRAIEHLCYGSKVANTKINHPPLYVQGFARSGTTHLHNLLSHDPQFGHVTMLQAAIAPWFLTGRRWAGKLITSRLPKKRPMDNMVVSINLPQEEEVVLASIYPYSFVHTFTFPRQVLSLGKRLNTMDFSDDELQQWKSSYCSVLNKAAIAANGKRLVLKSPANLGRSDKLQSLFPGTQFIHIVRNPFTVYMSMLNLYRKALPLFQLQEADWDLIREAIFLDYATKMRKYMDDRALIPEGNLVEMRFEDLEHDPLGQLERVYQTLNIPGWKSALPHLEKYLSGLKDYKKNRYEIEPEVIKRVEKEWDFVLEEWPYDVPQ